MATLTPSLASLLALLCAARALTSAQPSQPLLSLPESEVEESYAAYSALIRQELGTQDTSKVLILAYTRGGRDDVNCLKPPEKEHEADYKDQIGRYLERNRASYRLLSRFDIGRRYDLVDQAPKSEFPSFSVPYISLSAVGFNTAGNRAVVYMEHGIMGGAYFLTKVGGKWTVDFQRQPRTCGWIA
jgi:hypothetical protein